MRFTKMHGLGNDFIVIENLHGNLNLTKDKIASLCNRRFGIGADGLILVCPSNIASIKMVFYNNDGTEVEMCGNGIRCFAKYVYDNQIVLQNPMDIETLAGIKNTELQIMDSLVVRVRVDMGSPIFNSEENLKVDKTSNLHVDYNREKIHYYSASMGNPHIIIFVDDLDTYPIKEIGSFLEGHPNFPDKTNVNIVQILDKEHIKVTTWERGAGLTLACGTGACASAAISFYQGKIKDKIVAYLPGGKLLIEVKEHIFMTGEAIRVYQGVIEV